MRGYVLYRCDWELGIGNWELGIGCPNVEWVTLKKSDRNLSIIPGHQLTDNYSGWHRGVLNFTKPGDLSKN
jgi:hypothetical protein